MEVNVNLGNLLKMHSQQQPDGKFGFSLLHEGGDISFDNTWTDTWKEILLIEEWII